MLGDSPGLRADVRRFLAHGLMLDPWLAGMDQERFSFDSQELLGRAAEGLAAAQWQEPLITATLGDLPAATPALGRKAARAILDSTAATIASSRLGRIRVDLGIAREAVRRLETFAAAAGFGAAVHVYLLVETVMNLCGDGEIARRFEEAGLRSVRVERQTNETIFGDLEQAAYFVARSAPWLQRVLEIIPWDARHELIAELVDRGRQIMARNEIAERTCPFPSEHVRGEVPAAAGRGAP